MKTILITGANGQLGSAVTKEFLDKKYQVLATVSNERAKSTFITHENLDVQVVDLTNETDTDTYIRECIQKYQVIDAGFLLVGGFAMGNIAVTSGGDLNKQIALNFETAYYVTRPLFKHMREKKNGNIVFIGARPAIQPAQGFGLLAYSLSKSLLFKLAEFLNEEAKQENVRISVLVPSTIDTPVNRASMPDANPDNWVKPLAIAEILEFLVSDKATVLKETVLKLYNKS